MISGQCENLIAFMIFKHFDGFSWFLGNKKISGFSHFLTVFHDFWAMWKSHDFFFTFWRFFIISGQCENLMIFKHFDGFSWFLGNVKISWFSNFLTVFHDFWAMCQSHCFHDFYTFWRFFMISGQCGNLMFFKHFDGFSWFLGNVKISLLSWFLNTLTVFHDFWAMW
jgi:hypothetical protein